MNHEMCCGTETNHKIGKKGKLVNIIFSGLYTHLSTTVNNIYLKIYIGYV